MNYKMNYIIDYLKEREYIDQTIPAQLTEKKNNS